LDFRGEFPAGTQAFCGFEPYWIARRPAFAAARKVEPSASSARDLHALAHRKPDLFFLQICGMDGKRFDPIYAFVKHYRWKGIILEPLPDLFEALAANYAGSEGVAPGQRRSDRQ
jgi:hypothetical protein